MIEKLYKKNVENGTKNPFTNTSQKLLNQNTQSYESLFEKIKHVVYISTWHSKQKLEIKMELSRKIWLKMYLT